jgi:hypothetical protein
MNIEKVLDRIGHTIEIQDGRWSKLIEPNDLITKCEMAQLLINDKMEVVIFIPANDLSNIEINALVAERKSNCTFTYKGFKIIVADVDSPDIGFMLKK